MQRSCARRAVASQVRSVPSSPLRSRGACNAGRSGARGSGRCAVVAWCARYCVAAMMRVAYGVRRMARRMRTRGCALCGCVHICIMFTAVWRATARASHALACAARGVRRACRALCVSHCVRCARRVRARGARAAYACARACGVRGVCGMRMRVACCA